MRHVDTVVFSHCGVHLHVFLSFSTFLYLSLPFSPFLSLSFPFPLSFFLSGALLRDQTGLDDEDSYHMFCRILGRLKSNYQLSELVKSEGYVYGDMYGAMYGMCMGCVWDVYGAVYGDM